MNKPASYRDLAERMDAAAARAVHLWGAHKQLRQLTEECGELVAAVNQYERGRITAEHLASEIADVLICLVQARRILGGAKVDAQLEAKLERLEVRIAHAEHAAEVP
jgi:NTP pyrophosphatase (non-canonical NTP hydrolase)